MSVSANDNRAPPPPPAWVFALARQIGRQMAAAHLHTERKSRP